MTTKLSNGISLFCCSMGKLFRVTHVCPDSVSANQVMAKDRDTTCIAEDNNGFVYLAEAYASPAPSSILKDLRDNPPTHAVLTESEITELRFICANINSPSRNEAIAAAKEWHGRLNLMLRKLHPLPCPETNVH